VSPKVDNQITGSLSLGIDFGSLQSGEKHFFIKALQANWTFSNTVLFNPEVLQF